MKEEKFPHLGNILMDRDEGNFGTSDRTEKQVLRRQNGENSPQRSLSTNTSQPRSCLHAHCSNWGLGAEVQGSDPKERTEVDCHEDTLRLLV